MTGLGLSRQHGGMRPTAYRRNARGLRDRQAFEGVRMRAGALFAAGHSQAEVARTLGVARHNGSRCNSTERITRMATEQTPAPIDPKQLRSHQLREVNFQGDALRLGMNWTEDDLRKPQVLVESAYGMGHPGTFHFRGLVEEVSNGVFEAGGKQAEFVVSDICDGVVQATDGMSYSLISRDIMAAMIEIHALGHPHDAMVLISGNDKSVPAHQLAMARCDPPAVHVPGGTQLNAPDYVTSNKLWNLGASFKRGELTGD